MAKIPEIQDPTLLAVDAALEATQEKRARNYLGASIIGDPCSRKLWFGFRWMRQGSIPASGLRRINDGHRGEQVVAEMLRSVPEVDLSTEKEPGVQHSFEDLGGHFRGNCDGLIMGLLQSPKKLHVWECKVVNEVKFKKVATLKVVKGEDEALKHWDYVYYAQAQIYMHFFGATRHYLTVASPGVRDLNSIRTKYNQADAEALIAKANRIIFAPRAPAKISDDPAWHECKFCSFHGMCHDQEWPDKRSCRNCLHSTPIKTGGWKCELHKKDLSTEDQLAGCNKHLFHVDAVPGEVLDAGDNSVEYKLKDGSLWKDQAKS